MHSSRSTRRSTRASSAFLSITTGVTVSIVALVGATDALAQQTPWTQAEQGRYLAQAGDCAGCHTADGGPPLAGGKAVPTPFGKIYSANLTPDPETGIGKWSADDFYKAMHTGIDDEGKHLYPAFPYPWFTKLSRTDVDAIWVWLAIVKPVKNEVRKPDLPWPMSWRGSVAAWNKLFLHEGEYRPDPDKSAEWNRGAYLVEGAGHCGACHKPKNFLGGTDADQALEGGWAGEHWYAPDLTNDVRDGLGDWSVADVVEYLKTGSNSRSAAAGSMREVIVRSTQHLRDADLKAIAVYLKDQPGESSNGERSASTSVPTDTSAAKHDANQQGEALYVDNCTGCHMADGKGLANVFPPLDGASAIRAENPDTVIHVVVAGQRMAMTDDKPTGLAMPSFAGKLTNEEIADVVSYIRGAWSNRASAVDSDAVAAVRKVAQPVAEDAGDRLNRGAAFAAVRRR